MKRIRLFFKYLYTLNHYDTPHYPISFWDRYYKRRIGIYSAWKISGFILKQNKN